MAHPIKLHWSQSKPNFGDALSPLICEVVSGRKVIYATPAQADLIAIGSLLHRLKEGWFSRRVHIWGTGFIEATVAHRSRHFYHAVRGSLSQSSLINQDVPALGDPGLLADLLLPKAKQQAKKFKIGLVAHYKDKNNPVIKAVTERNADITEIDIFSPPLEFLSQLSECEIILSSAMHGLIAADALGIPNGWIKLSESLRGNDFKFRDYYSIFGLEPAPITLGAETVHQQALKVADDYRRDNIESIKKGLVNAFPYAI